MRPSWHACAEFFPLPCSSKRGIFQAASSGSRILRPCCWIWAWFRHSWEASSSAWWLCRLRSFTITETSSCCPIPTMALWPSLRPWQVHPWCNISLLYCHFWIWRALKTRIDASKYTSSRAHENPLCRRRSQSIARRRLHPAVLRSMPRHTSTGKDRCQGVHARRSWSDMETFRARDTGSRLRFAQPSCKRGALSLDEIGRSAPGAALDHWGATQEGFQLRVGAFVPGCYILRLSSCHRAFDLALPQFLPVHVAQPL